MVDTLDDAAWREIVRLLSGLVLSVWAGLTLILVGMRLRQMALSPDERRKLERQQRILGSQEITVRRHRPKPGQTSLFDPPRPKRKAKPKSKPESEQP